MKTFILLTGKQWHDELFNQLKSSKDQNWIRISNKEEFTLENLTLIEPDKIFIPHWSNIIIPEIFNRFECFVFHMTDLPFGRGGSPLQNLIKLGLRNTKISALKVGKGIDDGPIYLKRDLSLEGTALQIFQRAAEVILEMIAHIILYDPAPVPQSGEVTLFKRRTLEQSDITPIEGIIELYDHIRMLDCIGYPAAYLETHNFRFEFSEVSKEKSNELKAHVRIIKK
jgi:methionyl-tRNA formyltransferase